MSEYKIYRKYASVSKWSFNRPIEGWSTGKPLLNVTAPTMIAALSQASKLLNIGSGLLGAVRVQEG